MKPQVERLEDRDSASSLSDQLFQAVSASLAMQAWTIKNSCDMPKSPTADASGGWSFAFPQGGDYSTSPRVGYVVTSEKQPLSGTLSMTFTITATSGTVFNCNLEASNTGTSPAAVWLYLSDKNDNGDQYDRWWSRWDLQAQLQPGTFTLSVPLTHDGWNSVYANDANQTSIDRFAQALANPTDVGMTFGGGFYKGHGVNVSGGTATFHLVSYSVT